MEDYCQRQNDSEEVSSVVGLFFFLNTNKFSPNVNVVSMCSYNLASWEIYGFFSEVKSNYAYLYKKKNVPPQFLPLGLSVEVCNLREASCQRREREQKGLSFNERIYLPLMLLIGFMTKYLGAKQSCLVFHPGAAYQL